MSSSFGGFNCFRCGTWTPTGGTHFCGGAPVTPNSTIPGPIGWICPVCKKGNAPWAATCGHCAAPAQPTYDTAPLKIYPGFPHGPESSD